jgi:hypothetical protein
LTLPRESAEGAQTALSAKVCALQSPLRFAFKLNNIIMLIWLVTFLNFTAGLCDLQITACVAL